MELVGLVSLKHDEIIDLYQHVRRLHDKHAKTFKNWNFCEHLRCKYLKTQS